jgi:signal transduction histidine kinase
VLWNVPVFAIAVAAGLVLTYLLARRIVEPVKALDRAAVEVGRQNYDYEVPVKGEDELGRLAATFNAMCASIREAREELIRSERIATIGRLAASIVHDLRNPLATIYAGAEMLLYSQLSEAQIQRLAGNMLGASQRVQDLLQDLLDVGRGKTGEIRPCDLREIAGAVARSLESAAAAQQVRIVLDVPEGLNLPLDRRRIERVFLNLMGNALEAMPAGGAITVSAVVESDSVVVTVTDTGPGIALEIRSRLFQPFVTARKKTGLGLGLALARQAVVDHGGDMWADSSESGASFFSGSPGVRPTNRGRRRKVEPRTAIYGSPWSRVCVRLRCISPSHLKSPPPDAFSRAVKNPLVRGGVVLVAGVLIGNVSRKRWSERVDSNP